MTDRPNPRPSGALLRRPDAAKVLAVLVLGATCLAVSVRVPDGSASFYGASLLLAVIWTIGALWIGGLSPSPRTDVPRVAVITLIAAVVVSVSFFVGGWVASHIPGLDSQIHELVARTDYRFDVALIAIGAITGVAEEVFFRGALFSVLTRHKVVLSTVIYTVVTAATANLGLILAAAVLGLMTALARHYSGSLVPAVVAHLAWTISTVGLLPLVL